MIIKFVIRWIKDNIKFAFKQEPVGKILFKLDIPIINGYVVIYVKDYLIGCVQI